MNQRTGEYHQFLKFESGRRAKDFVKCDDPSCPLNKTWARRCKEYGWSADDYKPHCHPIY